MRKLKTFFRTLRLSISSPAYYADILKSQRSFTLKFFLGFVVSYALVATIIFAWFILLPLANLLSYFPDNLVKSYPQELVIDITNGQVEVNVDQPFMVPMKEVGLLFKSETNNAGVADLELADYFMVIDTQAVDADINKYSTLFLLTGNSLVYLEENGYRTTDLSTVDNFTVNKSGVESFAAQLKPLLKFILPLGSLVFFVFLSLFLLVGLPVYLLVFSLLMFILAKLFRVNLTFLQVYRLSMHMITLPLLVFGFLFIMGVVIPIPFLETLMMCLYAIVILFELKPARARVK